MDKQQVFPHVDHTNLKPTATWQDIDKLCQEGVAHHMASVCIPPAFVAPAKKAYGDKLAVCTVIGFPLGYQTTATKVFETKDAIQNGADEIDMVINIGDAKSGLFDKIEDEIRQIKAACQGKLLKVIIEACYLTDDEKIALCGAVTRAGAEYIKTSTGFGPSGATREDIKLFKQHIGPQVKMKAAGGIRSRQDMEDFLALGCERIGASAALTAYGVTDDAATGY